MFKHILIPLDGSTRAEVTLPLVARIAQTIGSDVVLLQVVNMPMSYGYGSSVGMGLSYGYGGGLGLSYGYSDSLDARELTTNTISARETEQAEATDYLTRIAHLDLFDGIPTATHVVIGQPASQILSLADKQALNLIVLCSHGQTGFLRWAIGSVTQRVTHHSHVPVLVVRDKSSIVSTVHTNMNSQFRVTVALDGSPLAEIALLPAAHLIDALSQHTQGVVHLLHVVKAPMVVADDDAISLRTNEEVEHAQAYLKGVSEHLLSLTSELNIQVTYAVIPAQDVADTIVTTAENGTESTGGNRCDVIAMATHGHGGVEHWVMGSVTEHVIGATTIPVLVVRPSKDNKMI